MSSESKTNKDGKKNVNKGGGRQGHYERIAILKLCGCGCETIAGKEDCGGKKRKTGKGSRPPFIGRSLF